MLKKWNRLLAILLAFALVTTTFGSDIASTRAFAVESDEELAQLESEDIKTADWEQIPEEGEQPASEEVAQEETTPEEVTDVTDQAGEESGASGDDAAVTESSVEAAVTESSVDEVATDASTESSTEDAAAEEASVEEAATAATSEPAVVEEKLVTVTYKATKGGSVSSNKETINVNDKDAKFEGATATAWNDKYTFVDWTDEDGNQVSTDSTFVPSGIEEDATFTANFVAAEDIAETMPAVEASEVHVDGLIVSVQAEEGLFPAGTEVVISAIPEDQAVATAEETLGKEVNRAKGVDITFKLDGNEIQPANNKYVHVKLDIEETIAAENLTVLHDHGDEVETINADVSEDAQGNVESVEFDSNQFSVFIVVDDGETDDNARLKVNFMNGEDEEDVIVSFYVKPKDLEEGTDGVNHFNDIIYDPGVGELSEGVMFRGWTKDKDYTTTTPALTIENIRSEITELLNGTVKEGESEVTYYAMLFKAYTVTYLDDRGSSLGSSEVKFRADDTAEYQSYTVNMQFIPSDNEHKFEGWNVSDGTDKIEGYELGANYPNGTVIKIKGNVILSVNQPSGHWLVFNENGKGATYNAPQFVKSGDVTHEPTLPMVRNGYTFDGWYNGEVEEDAQGNKTVVLGTEFVFGGTLTTLTNIYAKWVPNGSANYTVLIWKQNLDGNGYDYEETIILSGTTNTTVNTVTKKGTGNNAYAVVNGEDRKYTGFHLEEFTQNVTIAPEGGSVVNVYFDRNEYTFTFRKEVSHWWGTDYQTIHTVKKLYDQDISDIWSFRGSDGVNYPETYYTTSWMPSGSSTYTARITRMERMPAEDITFTLTHTSNTKRYFHYYIEAPEGTTGTRTYDGRQFILYTDLTNDFNYVYYNDDFWLLAGFSRLAITKSGNQRVNLTKDKNIGWDGEGGLNQAYGGDNNHLYFYYTRDAYSINYMDGSYFDGNNNPVSEPGLGQIHTETNISYQADISSNGEYKPTNVPAGYVFESWCVDDACTKEYEFDKMPKDGVTVYAKWRQIQYRVFLHPLVPKTDNTLDWGSETQAMNFRISYNGHVSLPTGTRNGYEFAGWYREPDYQTGFNAEAYALNEETVTTPYDKTVDMTDTMDKWGEGATENSDITGYNGKDRFWITKKLDLYAKWRETLTGAKGIGIIYDVGEGSPAPSDTNLYADTAMATAGAAPTNTPNITEDGKTYESRFSHWVVQKWNTTANRYEDTDVTVLPGATFEVKKSDAREQDLDGFTEEGEQKKSYTVQLRAEYKKVEKPVPTHITWYNNYNGGTYREDTELDVNESVPVFGLGQGEDIPSRKGFVFKGWAREEETVGTTTDSTTLFISYSETEGYSADKVAADEKAPYHALYAVWDPLPTYTVTYVLEGTVPEGVVAPVDEDIYLEDETVTVLSVENIPAGYKFDEWTSEDIEGEIGATFEMPAKSVTLVGTISPRDDVAYTVEHYFQPLDDGEYVIDDTLTETKFNGVTGQDLSDEVLAGLKKTVEGFTYVEGGNKYVITTGEIQTPTVQGDGSLVVKLYYDRNLYKVTYSYTNDPVPAGATELPTEAEYKYGQTVDLAEDAEAPGYDFSGWDTEDAEVSENSFTMPAKDVEVTGTFTARDDVQYTVEHYFESLDEEEGYVIDDTLTETKNNGVADQDLSDEVLEGLKKTVEGFTYVEGGNKYSTSTGEIQTPTVQGDGSLVVKLYYSRNLYKVTYSYTNDPVPAGATTLPAEAEYKYGDTVTAADKAEAPGYTFVGWKVKSGYTLGDGEEIVTTFPMPANDVALEGTFVANEDVKYTARYFFQDIDDEGSYVEDTSLIETREDGKTDTELTSSQLSSLVKSVPGFEYITDGNRYFSSKGEITVPTVQGDGSLEVHIYYNRKSYKVTYSYTNEPVPAGATTLPTEAEYKYGQTVTLAADAEAPGYDFSGWKGNYKIDENGNLIEKILELITGEQKFIMPAADVNITGTFTAREDVKYTVQYFFQPLDDGEYVIDDNLTETKDNGVADQDLSETTLKSFEKEIEGFTYVEGGNKYYAGETVLGAPTVQGDGSLIVRLFYSRNSYKVTYSYTNDPVPAGATELPTEAEYKYGQAVDLAEDAEAPGYDFSGWDTEDAEVSENSFTMPAKDVEVTGTFTARDDVQYTVEHYFQSLENEDDYEIDDTLTETKNNGVADQDLSDEVLEGLKKTVEGFTYVEGGNKYVITTGEIQTPTVQGDGSLVVKLYYDRNLYKVTYSYTNDPVPAGATELPTEAEYKYGQTVDLAEDAEAPGYDFSGWDTEDAEVSENSFTMPAKDVEVTGTFTARDDVQYTVEHYFQSLENEDDYEIDDTLTETKNNGVADQDLSDEVLEGFVQTVEGFTYVEGGNKYFAGEEELDGPTVQGNGSLVVKLYYDREGFEVKYTLAGDKIPEGAEAPQTVSYKFGEEVTVEDGLTAEGFVFEGWETKSDVAIENNKFEMPAENIEFIGVFQEITYRISFEYRMASGVTAPANFDELNEEVKTHNGEYPAGEVVTLPERATIDGYVVGAWQIEKVENEEGDSPLERAIAKAKELLALQVSAADDETIEVPEYDSVIYCIIDTIPGPPTPPPTPDPTPTPGPTTIPDAPAPAAPAPAQAVLGARREEGNGQAVLGARRARTEDTTNDTARVFAIIMSAAAAITLFLTGKKKEEEEEG